MGGGNRNGTTFPLLLRRIMPWMGRDLAVGRGGRGGSSLLEPKPIIFALVVVLGPRCQVWMVKMGRMERDSAFITNEQGVKAFGSITVKTFNFGRVSVIVDLFE